MMLVKTAVGKDTQWFEYRPGYFKDVTRVEWDKDTMSVSLPSDTAEYLIRHGYARVMTTQEMDAYTAPPKEEPERKPVKAKKGD